MKNFWLLAAIFVSFFIGRFSLSHLPTSLATDEIKLSSNQEVSIQKTESAELTQINLKLKAEINQLKQQLLNQQISATPKTQIPVENEIKANGVIEKDQALTDAEEFTKQVSTDSNNFFQQIKEKFNQEPIDPNWAQQQQQRINHWLKSTKELENFSAEDITCKTTGCRIIFPIRSTEISDELTQTISKVAQQSGDIIKNSIIYDHSTAGSLSLYIAREK